MNKLKEKHKFYFLIVMLCVAGLIGYVRFFRASTATEINQTAMESSDQRTATLTTTRQQTLSNGGSTPRKGLTRRHVLRNIFEPAVPLPAIAAPVQKASQTPPADMSLSGTIIDGNQSMAIINNQFMLPGQKLGKYQITRITPDKVFLAAGEDRRCLRVITVTEAITE